jgi:hypothetical protein
VSPDQLLARLNEEHGGRWHIWWLPIASGLPSITWHAIEWANADLTQVLHADSADHLREYITDWQKEHPANP